MTLFYCNARGLNSKGKEWAHFLELYSPDIVCLTETKGGSVHSKQYHWFDSCYNSCSGSSLIGIKKNSVKLIKLTLREINVIAIDFQVFDIRRRLICVYIPCASVKIRNDTVGCFYNLIDENTIIVGDFNANLIDFNSRNKAKDKWLRSWSLDLDLINIASCFDMDHFPTYRKITSGCIKESTLDYFFATSENLISNFKIGTFPIFGDNVLSDHLCILANLYSHDKKSFNSRRIPIRIILYPWYKFKVISWLEEYSDWERFKHQVRFHSNRLNKLWFSDLKCFKKAKEAAQEKYKDFKNSLLWSDYAYWYKTNIPYKKVNIDPETIFQSL